VKAVRKFGLGTLLVLANLAFAATTGVINPICSVVEALAANWNIIVWLVVGILGVMVMVVGVVELTAGKAHRTLVVVLGGAVILVATYRLLDAAGGALQTFKSTCGGSGTSQLNIIVPYGEGKLNLNRYSS
jgi:hypothetical protein